MFKAIITLVEVVDGNLKKFLKLQSLIILASVIELSMVVIIPFWFSTNLINTDSNNSFLLNFVSENKSSVGLLSIILIIMSSVLNIYTLYRTNLYSFNIGQKTSFILLKKYLNESYLFHQENDSSKLVSNINTESLRLANFFLNPFFILNSKIIVVFFIVLFLLIYNPITTLFSLGFFLIFYLLIYRIIKQRLKNNGETITEINSEKIKISEESIFAFIEVNLYKLKSGLLNRFDMSGSEFRNISAVNNLIAKFPKYLIELLLFSSLVAIIAFGKDEKGAFQTIVIFGFAAYKLLPYIQQIFSTYTVMKANYNSFEVLESDIIHSAETNTKFFEINNLKKLALDNVYFGYSGKKLLDNFSYTFNAGNIYGLVGESGSGKSTLLKIIMGFIVPSSGQVSVDDIMINDSWLKNVAYVSQNSIILNISIGKNIDINYNGDEQSRTGMIVLLESLGLRVYLEEINYDLDHILTQKGGNISGGQLQRIAIARALYLKSNLIIFDEATSALDNNNQRLLMELLKTIAKNSIVIISTHRKETLEFCNHIIKL